MMGALSGRGMLALAASAAGGWIATFALLVTDLPEWATVFAVIAGSLTLTGVIFSVRRDARLIFKHGFHVGFHAAAHDNCPYPACDIVQIAEHRASRYL